MKTNALIDETAEGGSERLLNAVMGVGTPVMTPQGTVRQVTRVFGSGYQVLGLGLFNAQSIQVMMKNYAEREGK